MIKKYITILFAGGLMAGSAIGQTPVYDSVEMGKSYKNQVYYDMANGIVDSATVLGWDIAHTSDIRDNCIRANHMTGIEIFHYRNSGGWAGFDTAGWKAWPKNYNDLHVHEKGAFNLYYNAPWGFGWGTYNSGSHEVVGDSLYLIAWATPTPGVYSKFMKFEPIVQNTSGDLIFRYANLDGSNEVQDTLFQSQANNQNYKYYSFATSAKPVREPSKLTWDISFTRYYDKISTGPSTYVVYPLMGVESNRGTKAAKIISPWDTILSKNPTTIMNTYMGTVANDLTAIGGGWKVIDMTVNPPVYHLADTQSFMVKSIRNGDSTFWLIHFTGFTGTISGAPAKTYFTKILLGKTNVVSNPEIGQMRVFPNPASDRLFVSLEDSKIKNASLKLYSLTGAELRTSEIKDPGAFSSYSLSLNGLAKGIYVLSIEAGKSRITQQVVIQ